MSKRRERQILIRAWKEETGATDIDMHLVVKWALGKGYPLPKPKSLIDILVKEFSDAARDEVGKDPATGRPYRVYHSYPVVSGQTTLFHWMDIHEAPRRKMHKSLVNRREQMVGDGLQLTLDQTYWNSVHKDDEPISLPMDLTPDIEWRLNAPDEDDKAA
jgi:hypothetical protein